MGQLLTHEPSKILAARIEDAESWQEAVDRLTGQDLILAVHEIKRRFGVTDAELTQYLGY